MTDRISLGLIRITRVDKITRRDDQIHAKGHEQCVKKYFGRLQRRHGTEDSGKVPYVELDLVVSDDGLRQARIRNGERMLYYDVGRCANDDDPGKTFECDGCEKKVCPFSTR